MPADPYGYCPQCGAPGTARERRLGGNDTCRSGHTYPSAAALRAPPATPAPADPFADLPPDVRAVVDSFQAARRRVALAMVRTPLLAHERDARKRLLADLETVWTFIAAIDTIHAEGSPDAR